MTAEALPSALPNLQGFWLWLARTIWVIIALLCISLFVLGTLAQYSLIRKPCSAIPPEIQPNCWRTESALEQVGLTWDDVANFYTPIATVGTLPLFLLGCLIFLRKSETILGLLFSLAIIAVGSSALNREMFSTLWLEYPGLRVPALLIHFLGNISLLIFCFLFPDGRFVPQWTRWLLLFWAGHLLYNNLSTLLVSSYGVSPWRMFFFPTLNILMMAVTIYVMVYRYRHHAGPLQRQQIKWVILALSVMSIFAILFNIFSLFAWSGFFVLFIIFVYSPLWYFGALFVAICFGVSISRYRLWDIDFLINRTLVYSLLTAFIVGIYVIVVGVLGTAIQGRSNLLISILATGFVAILVQPLRDRLQRSINRLMYGERDDPVTVLSRLGQRLEATLAPDAVLPALTETIAQTLKLPYAAITWGAEDAREVAASYGQPAGKLTHLPLTHQGEIIGELVIASRSPREAFSPADHHLLKNIAQQAGMAVHAVRLTVELQRSRQNLVTAREEERRRLRRDLHDGLGPNLASQGLKFAAIKQFLEKNPDAAAPLLEQVLEQNQSTVDEVRRLVYGLRPPALDELGLVAAIRDYGAGMDGKSGLQIEVTEPSEGLPPLPAAVEVAAYRIILEALTNVIRHARAQQCLIRFSMDQNDYGFVLQFEIQDDGIGLPSTRRAGVGTRSMRERAEEVGGTCVIESMVRHGTRVCVRIPLTVV